jgi:hypothetical protein
MKGEEEEEGMNEDDVDTKSPFLAFKFSHYFSIKIR